MHLSVDLDESLCEEARQRAGHEGLSLSGWIGKLLAKELKSGSTGDGTIRRTTLLELLGDKHSADHDFEPPKLADTVRPAEL